MLSDRFRFDGMAVLELNELQREYKRIVEKKLEDKIYDLEEVDCVICGSADFELLAEKDRYGFFVSTVVCRVCGLLQTNPRMTQRSYDDFYETCYRQLYGGVESATDEFFAKQRTRGEGILDFLENAIGHSFTGNFIVEVGTGAGGILQVFEEHGNDVLGLDIGSQFLEFGKAKGLDLTTGTIAQLEGMDRKADLVIYSHVLEHILDPRTELQTLRRYLSRNGMVYIEVPGIYDLKNSYQHDFLRYLQNAHVYHFCLNTMKNLTRVSGYELIRGNEKVKSLFRPAEKERYTNEYSSTMIFLKDLERQRSNPLSPHKLRRRARNALISLTKSTNTYDTARNVLRTVRRILR